MQKKDSGKGNYYGKYDDGINRSIQESEGRQNAGCLLCWAADTFLKRHGIDGKIVWESRKNGYFHGYTDEIKNITESGITILEMRKYSAIIGTGKKIVICGAVCVDSVIKMAVMMDVR